MRGSTIPLSYANGSRGLLITPVHPPPMSGPTIVLLYAQGERGLLFSPVHPPHHLGGVLLSCYHMPRAAEDYYSPQSPPPPMKCSTILLSYAESSRGLLFTTVHPPPYKGFYSPVITCPGEQRTIIHPNPPSLKLLIPKGHPPYEEFYYIVIICHGEQRTINHTSPPPPPPL